MALDESKNPEDSLDEAYGVKIVVDQKFSEFLEGAVINYDESEGAFQIKTPYQSSCGSDCSSGSCGS